MKTFKHPDNFIDQFRIGDTVQNPVHNAQMVITEMGVCHKTKLCRDCKTEGVIIKGIREDNKHIVRWCHSLWGREF
jgi:hypothetical protein